MQTSPLAVVHIVEQMRFEVQIDSQTAELTYSLSDGAITFMHTAVPSALEGRGIGSLLVRSGLKFARENNLQVQSLCWFVDQYRRRHPTE